MFLFILRAAALAAATFPIFSSAAPLTLGEALQLATQRSELARAAEAGASSAREASHAAGQLPDPVLGITLENLPVTGPDRFSMSRDNFTMKRIGISQEWVSAEKRLLRTAASSAMVARERSAFAAANAETRLQTTLAYIDAYFAAEALKLALVNESHAKEAVLTAQSRLASGSGNAQEVLGLASAQGIAEDETADLRQQLESVRISLVRWTGVPVEDLSVPDLPRTPGEQAFVDTNPTTVAKRLELEVNRQEAAITASNRNPNWTWQASYGQRTGFSDMATIGVSIPIPIAPGNRQDRETASKLALVDKAEAELAEAGRIAQAEYRQLVSEQEHHVHRIERYEVTVLATAVQRTATATAAYRSNQASLTTVFDARHAELDARRKILTMQRELSKMRAQLAFKPLRAEEFQ